MTNFSFLSGSNILVRVGGWVGGWGGFTVIIMQVSVQIGLNLTGLELSLAKCEPNTVTRVEFSLWPKNFVLGIFIWASKVS